VGVMICTFISRILGFLRLFVITRVFGEGGVADVMNGVFNLPNNLRRLFAEGALSSAFIPTLSSSVVEDSSGARPKKIARNLFTFLLIILVPLVLAAFIFARPLVHLMFYFPEVYYMEMAVNLFRWIFSYILFISISAVIMGALNAKNSFIIPAITPILHSVCVIGSIIISYLFLNEIIGVYSLAIGVISGGIAQIIFQLPIFFKKGYDLKLDFQFNNPDFRQIFRKWLLAFISSAVFTINQIIAVAFASGLGYNSITALQIAIIFFELPLGIFSNSIITVLFPRMSRQAALLDIEGLRESISYGLRFIFILLIPVSLLLIFLGEDTINVLYPHFSQQATARTAMVLAGYTLGLFSTGALTLLQRFFFSFKDFITPFIVAVIILIIDVTSSLILKETFLRVAGLAVANSIAFTIGLIILVLFARYRLKRFQGKKILITILKTFLAVIPLLGIIAFYYYIKDIFMISSLAYIYRMIVLFSFYILAVGVTALMYLILKVDIFYDLLRRKFFRGKEEGNG
jgi:putative peptidoglycan lipid II flippase